MVYIAYTDHSSTLTFKAFNNLTPTHISSSIPFHFSTYTLDAAIFDST